MYRCRLGSKRFVEGHLESEYDILLSKVMGMKREHFKKEGLERAMRRQKDL